MSISKRIREIRKALPNKTTQGEFGEPIGATRGMIMSYEMDRVVPPESVIKMICATYGVSYVWLKYGTGDMHLPPDTDDELVDKVMTGSNDFAKNVMKAFAKLGDDEWQLLKKIVDEIQKAGR